MEAVILEVQICPCYGCVAKIRRTIKKLGIKKQEVEKNNVGNAVLVTVPKDKAETVADKLRKKLKKPVQPVGQVQVPQNIAPQHAPGPQPYASRLPAPDPAPAPPQPHASRPPAPAPAPAPAPIPGIIHELPPGYYGGPGPQCLPPQPSYGGYGGPGPQYLPPQPSYGGYGVPGPQYGSTYGQTQQQPQYYGNQYYTSDDNACTIM